MIAATAALCFSAITRAEQPQTQFLDFPLVTQTVAASKTDTFAWLVRQADRTHIRVASAPRFEPRTVLSATDHDGQPITEIALSADGKWLVYGKTAWFGPEQPHNPASLLEPPPPTLWAMSTEPGAVPKRIGPGVGPLFAPNGARVLYRHENNLRIAELGAATVEDRVLIPGGAAFSGIQWSPDGDALAFAHDRGGYAFLGIYRLGEDRLRWLVTGPDRATSPVWSADGKRIAYSIFPGREHTKAYDLTESEPFSVNVVQVETGRSKTLWQTAVNASAPQLEDPDGALRWMSSEQLVFYSEHDGWGRLYSLQESGGQPRALTPPSCEVAESAPVSSNALLVIHNCNDAHTRQMGILDIGSAALRPLRTPDMIVATAAAASRNFVALAGGNADTAPLVRIVDVRDQKVRLREEPSAYGYSRPAFASKAPSAVTFKAADGVTVPAQLFFPARVSGRHPALIFVHGGPQRQMFPAYHYMDYYALTYAINRRLAELGYVVLSINYRSGTGYGREFREAPGRGWRDATEYQDVTAGARWLAARPDVDAKRIGIWGGSYGGLLTGHALARNSDLFAAGVAVHGLYDWSWPSPTPHHLNPSRIFGASDATQARAFAASPLAAIDGWKSPVLLFTGDADMNVDVLETVDLAQKLRARNVHVETVLVPGESHGLIQHATVVRLWRELSEFLDKHLRAGRSTE